MPYRKIIIFIIFIMNVFLCERVFSQSDGIDIATKVLNEGVSALEPENIFVWVDFPKIVKLNSTINLKIEIENLRSKNAFEIESIDIGNNIGQGFRLKKVTPKPKDVDTFMGELSLEYSYSLKPGESTTVILELIAVNEGIFKGEVDIWEGDNMLTRVAQSRIIK